MNLRSLCLALGGASLPLAVQAQEAPKGLMPANGIFAGAGMAFNGATFPNQDIYGYGISEI